MDKSSHSCSFYAEHIFLDRDITGGLPNGFPSPRLAYIIEGECKCISSDGEITMKAGDVWSLPSKKGYKSIWKKSPNIDFYFMEYDADFFSFKVKFFKKIENLNLKRDFITLYSSNNNFERLASFYNILNNAAPYIFEDNDQKINTIIPALEYIRNNYEKPLKVKGLAKLCYMSESKFYSEFKKIVGTSPIEYKNGLKALKAAEMISNKITLENICEILEYSSPAFLRRQVKKHIGISPRELKNKINL